MTSSKHSLEKTLNDAKEVHVFLRVSDTEKPKDKFSTSKIQIEGHKLMWSKNPEVVYSPATHLVGTKSHVIDFLKWRTTEGDESSEKIMNVFSKDKGMITQSNVDKHKDYITDMTRSRKEYMSENATSKTELIDRQNIPDILLKVREMRGTRVSNAQSDKDQVMSNYLATIAKDGKFYRIKGCQSNGKMSNSSCLSSLPSSSTFSTKNIFLGNTAPLDHFFMNASYEDKPSVVNFMTLYYMHINKELKSPEASKKAREFAETLLAPYKKTSGRKSRSASPVTRKSRAASTAGSEAVTRKSRSMSSKSPSKSRTSSPANSAASSRRTRSHAKTPSRSPTRSPRRSPSPSTSPKAAPKKKFSMPPKSS